eukprot:5933417-Pleurochrysis_carterae.AAC.1
MRPSHLRLRAPASVDVDLPDDNDLFDWWRPGAFAMSTLTLSSAAPLRALDQRLISAHSLPSLPCCAARWGSATAQLQRYAGQLCDRKLRRRRRVVRIRGATTHACLSRFHRSPVHSKSLPSGPPRILAHGSADASPDGCSLMLPLLLFHDASPPAVLHSCTMVLRSLQDARQGHDFMASLFALLA